MKAWREEALCEPGELLGDGGSVNPSVLGELRGTTQIMVLGLPRGCDQQGPGHGKAGQEQTLLPFQSFRIPGGVEGIVCCSLRRLLVLSVLWAELCSAKGNPRMVWFFPRGKEIRREKALILMGGRSLGSLRQIPGNVSKWIQLNK